jgi:hypothetical protein
VTVTELIQLKLARIAASFMAQFATTPKAYSGGGQSAPAQPQAPRAAATNIRVDIRYSFVVIFSSHFVDFLIFFVSCMDLESFHIFDGIYRMQSENIVNPEAFCCK